MQMNRQNLGRYTVEKNGPEYEKNGPDRVYVNITIPHNDSVSLSDPTPARFFQVRSDSFLGNARPSDYSLSVIRFQVPSSYIPLFIFPVQYNPSLPSDPNYSTMSVTLSYGGNDYQTYLIYVPQESYLTPPPGPTLTDPVKRPQYIQYYSLYSVQWMLDIINVALATSFKALKLAHGGIVSTQPPIFAFDPATDLISLYAPVTYESPAVPLVSDGIQIFVNNPLSNLFGTAYDFRYNGFNGVTNGKNVEFLVKNLGTNNVTLPTITGPSYKMSGEYDVLPLWLPLKSIIFASSSIPIRQENVTASIGGFVPQLSDSIYPILTDFKLDTSTGFEYKAYINYVPTAEYRRLDLLGNTQLNTLDIQIYWSDNYQNLYPLVIPANDEASVKLLFEKKKN